MVRRAASSRMAAAACILFLLALFVHEQWRGALDDAQTSDESVAIASGYSFLRTGRVWINPEHPMLGKCLIAAGLLPMHPTLDLESDAWRHHIEWVASYEFLWENRIPGRALLLRARLPVIACGLLVILVLYATARAWYGSTAGLLALLFAATNPDLLGHSHLATLDVPLTLAAVGALAALLHYAERPTRGRHCLLALALGVVLATKVSGLQLLPPLALAALVRVAVDPGLWRRGGVRPPWPAPSLLASAYVLLGGFLVAAVYAFAFLWLTYLGSLRPYLVGLVGNAELSGSGHPSYLLGETSTQGFPGYFLVALGVKLPVLTLALLVAALVTWPFLRVGRRELEAPLVAFALTLLGLASLMPSQVGVRYLLPIYPVLLLFSSRLGSLRPARAWLGTALFATVALAQLGVWLSARPGYLSYFNELAGGGGPLHPPLLDSNLDWGQDLGRLGDWLATAGSPPVRLSVFSNAPPEAYGVRYQALPAAGPVLPPAPVLTGVHAPDLVCVSANNLHGLFFRSDLYSWLRQREPLEVIGSIVCYDLGGRREGHLRLAETYRAYGWSRFEAHERELAAHLP